MTELVEVNIPVEADVAAILSDAAMRDEVGRFITDMIRARAETDPLLNAMNKWPLKQLAVE